MMAIGQPSTDSIHARWKTSGASGATDNRPSNHLGRGGSVLTSPPQRTATKARPHGTNGRRLRDLRKPGLRLRDDHPRERVAAKRLTASEPFGDRGPVPPHGSEGGPQHAGSHRQAAALSSHIPTGPIWGWRGRANVRAQKVIFLQKINCMGNLAAPYRTAPHEGG